MHRASSSRSSKPSSSRSKASGSSSSSARGRSSHRSRSRSRSRSPRSRRRHRSRSSGRSSRRSPPSRRSSRRRSPGKRSHSPGKSSHSPGKSSHSPGKRSHSPGKRSHSPGKRSHSPGKRSHSPDKRSPSLSDVNRDDLADGPIFSSGLPRPQSIERYSPSKETPASPFNTGQDEDYRFRDDFLHQSDYSTSYNHLQYLPRETERYRMLLGKPSEDTGQDLELPKHDKDDRLLKIDIEPEDFLSGTWNFCKQDPSRSPSLPFHDVDLRVLEYAGRKSKEEELSRNCSQDPEHKYIYRPNEISAMPKKSILKKHRDDPSVQPEVFSSSSASLKEPPLLSDDPPFPQRTNSIAPFSAEEVKFLKQFNKNADVEPANTTSEGNVHNWKLHSGQKQNISHYKQNFGSFLNRRECHESTSEPEDQHSYFLLPHERASQDGNGFSNILSMKTDSTSTQEKRRNSLIDDVEAEEKFLYGDNGDDSIFIQRITLSGDKEHGRKKINSPPASLSVKSDTLEESRPEHEKIYDLLKTIGLDIGVAEIGKLAARTQERLHGKKASRSPDRRSVASRKPRKESRESKERHCSKSDTHSPESRWNHSPSPDYFPPSKEMSPASHSKHTESKIVRQDYHFPQEQAVPMASPIPSAPPCLPHMFPAPIYPQYSVPFYLPFGATHLPQNYPPPTMPPPGYNPYGQYFTYASSGWATYPPPQQAGPEFPNAPEYGTPTVPPNHSVSNVRVIQTISTTRRTCDIKRKTSMIVQTPFSAPPSKLLPQPTPKGAKEKIPDDRNRAAQKQKVLEERGKLKAEQEARQKKLHYLTVELNRLTKQEGEMMRKMRKAKDPLLVEVNQLREKIAKEVDQLQMHSDAAEKKQSELDKVALILGINIFEKARKQSSGNKDSSEKDKSENGKK
ncbi:zinc finger protein 318-like isoform X1 [Podarcis muralis]